MEGQIESAAAFNEMYNFALSAISKSDSSIKSDLLRRGSPIFQVYTISNTGL